MLIQACRIDKRLIFVNELKLDKNKIQMKITFTLLIICLISISYACHNNEKEAKTETSTTQISAPPIESEHRHSESDSIELNNGAKWIVVPDMMKFIRTMESDITQFSVTQTTDLKDFQKLGVGLQKNIDLLTSNCTMEGKAHDELHKWLVPYIDMVSKLNESKNSNEAFTTFEELKASFQTFNQYFE